MPGLTLMPNAPTPADEAISLPPNIPSLPDDVKDRFGSMRDWEEEMGGWWHQVNGQLQNLIPSAAAAINNVGQAVTTQIQSFSSSLQQVSTVVGGKNAIYVQSTAPLNPNVDDLWVDTSSGNQFKFWDGTLWQYKQDQVLAAAISTESTTRATADGFLSAKYTLTVVAGNVVTGMNITSSTGGGTNISNVTFQAGSFLIYNGSAGAPVFSASGGVVYLANTLVVDQAHSKVYIGTGTYADAGTQFYVDSTGKFSLGSNFTWDGSTLTITGNLSASGIETNCVAFNAANPTSTFPTTGYSAGQLSAGAGALAGTQNWYNGYVFNGWSVGAGFNNNTFGKSTTVFVVFQSGQFNCNVGTIISASPIYRINGGATNRVDTLLNPISTASDGTNTGTTALVLAGLLGTDVIEFGIQTNVVAGGGHTGWAIGVTFISLNL